MTAITRLGTTEATPDWEQALCAQTDPELFFPEGVGAQIVIATTQAKRICAQCSIRRGCLSWALATGQPAGIWGGMDKEDRKQIRSRATRAARAGVKAA